MISDHPRSFAAALVFLFAGCGSTHQPRRQPAGPPSAQFTGRLALPAAEAFGAPGFHQPLGADGVFPSGSSGRRLVVTLRDAGRPNQSCSQDHPLSGCATVDWSDDPSRPAVPPGGVFLNSVTVTLASGPRTLYLRRSGAIASSPDRFEPG